MVVECKSDNVTIIESDYWQGESYARAVGCELFGTPIPSRRASSS
jgi:type I restriction enzyme M protein